MTIGPGTEGRLAEALRRTGSVPLACDAAGITPRQLQQALAGDEAQRDRLEAALFEGLARLDREIYELAFEPREPRDPILQRNRLVFGWWDGEAGAWIDPDTFPGGEDALRGAAEAPGATVRRKPVTRAPQRNLRALFEFVRRHDPGYRNPEKSGGGREILADAPAQAPGRAPSVDAPGIMPSVEEWSRKYRIPAGDAPED